jgi:hypothetical protein
MPDQKTETVYTPLLEDSLIAIGYAVSTDNDKSQPLVFAGIKHSYLLTKGAEEISAIANSFDGNHLLINYETYYDFEHKQQTSEHEIKLITTQTGFKGTINVAFLRHSGDYTPTELTNLERLGFSKAETPGRIWGTNVIYRKTVALEGRIYPSAPNIKEVQNKFKRHRNMTLYSTKEVTSSNTGKLTNLPSTILVDVATLPFQLIFLPFLMAHSTR